MAYLIMLMAVITGVITRFVDHPFNFTPIMAIVLFSGCFFNKRIALIIPFILLLLSDSVIGFYQWEMMLSVYLSFALVGLIGVWLRNHKSIPTVIGGTLIGSVLFYLITNFAFWAFTPAYPSTIEGLVSSYVAAIPFFRNGVVGDLFYVSFFFGSYELIQLWIKKHPKKSLTQIQVER